MSADLALELEDVVFRYQEKGRRNILDHTSLTIPAGTLTVLMGGSGCGKSTLAAVAAGLYPENGGFLESGIIRLYGQDLKMLDPQKRAAYLTVLFQNPDLQFCMNTLREEMRFCLENICIPAGKMDERINQAAAELGITPLLDQTLSTLSGGEKQKAALSCLYVMESRCILLDESFANLDREAAVQLLEMLLRMKASGRTILAITIGQTSGWRLRMRSFCWKRAAEWPSGTSTAKTCRSTARILSGWVCFTRVPGRNGLWPARQRADLCYSSGESASARGCPSGASGAARCTMLPFWCRVRMRISRRAV